MEIELNHFARQMECETIEDVSEKINVLKNWYQTILNHINAKRPHDETVHEREKLLHGMNKELIRIKIYLDKIK